MRWPRRGFRSDLGQGRPSGRKDTEQNSTQQNSRITQQSIYLCSSFRAEGLFLGLTSDTTREQTRLAGGDGEPSFTYPDYQRPGPNSGLRFVFASNSVDFIHQLRSTLITVEKWYGDSWLHILLRKKREVQMPCAYLETSSLFSWYEQHLIDTWCLISWTAHQEQVMKVSLAYCSEHLISTVHEISILSISVSLGTIETLPSSSNLSENWFCLTLLHWALLWSRSALKHQFVLCSNFLSS